MKNVFDDNLKISLRFYYDFFKKTKISLNLSIFYTVLMTQKDSNPPPCKMITKRIDSLFKSLHHKHLLYINLRFFLCEHIFISHGD